MVLHRIDDLEIDAGKWSVYQGVLHRIDDLEKRCQEYVHLI